jgi:hypothetical protein
MNKLDYLVPIMNAHLPELKKPGVAFVRPGYKIENGWPTREPAIVVVLSQNATPPPDIPAEVDGVKVDVRTATAVEQMRHDDPAQFAKIASNHPEVAAGALPEIDPVAEEAVEALAPEVLAAKPQIQYTPAAVPLAPVSGKMTITCHASPDAGWPTLQAFLNGTQSRLTVGMYDFTSEHILEGMKSALSGTQSMTLTLDNPALNPTADQSDPDTRKDLEADLGDRFDSAWALVRGNKAVPQWIFPTAYHIKVAVRDGNAFWLSSGNWNNSNQPDMDPINNARPDDQQRARKSDRDWHVVVENADLANTYEKYLEHDFEVAQQVEGGGGPGLQEAAPPAVLPESFQPAAVGTWQFFAPLKLTNQQMTITPLLTPDPGVYTQAMLRLLKSATQKIYIQLQYIHPSDADIDADFNELIDTVVQKLDDGVDVRIICSQFQKSNGWLERLQSAGVDLQHVKLQNGVHNKGFVVDSKVVALGSQNWSGDGALRNRDASVIIENEQAAKYYERIFLHDWTNIAKQSVSA